jgi:hypothetical protein
VSYLLVISDIVAQLFKKPREERALLRAKNQIKSADLTKLGHLDQIRTQNVSAPTVYIAAVM